MQKKTYSSSWMNANKKPLYIFAFFSFAFLHGNRPNGKSVATQDNARDWIAGIHRVYQRERKGYTARGEREWDSNNKENSYFVVQNGTSKKWKKEIEVKRPEFVSADPLEPPRASERRTKEWEVSDWQENQLPGKWTARNQMRWDRWEWGWGCGGRMMGRTK